MSRLKNDKIQILDGGMGRELERIGAPFKQPEWSALSLMEAPHYVEQAHRSFIDAGADIITTNAYALVPYHIGDDVFTDKGQELIKLSAQMARQATYDSDTLIAGCIPPPFGSYKPDQFDESKLDAILTPLIEEQIDYIDFWLVETMSCLEEAVAIYERLKKTGKPIWVSFTVPHMDDHSLPPILRSGEDLHESLIIFASKTKPEAVLFNCCRPEEVEHVLKTARNVMPDMQLGAYPNNFARLKVLSDANYNITEMRLDTSPKVYADLAEKWVDMGASIIGGCCGIGPDYIKALSDRFKETRL